MSNSMNKVDQEVGRFVNTYSNRIFEWLFCLASGYTSFVGLRALTGWSWYAVALPVVANQGMMYAAAHSLERQSNVPRGQKYYKAPRVFVWAFCFTVSVMFSAIGLFELAKGSIDVNQQRTELQRVWNSAVTDVHQFRADASGFINQKREVLDQAIAVEERRINWARTHQRDYSTKRRDELKAKKVELNNLEDRVREDVVIGSFDSSKAPQDVRAEMETTFRRVSEVYGLMSDEFRQNPAHKLPQPTLEKLSFTNSYDAFVEQLRLGSWQAIFCLILALGFDLVPTLNVRSRTPMRSTSTLIRDFFTSIGESKQALWDWKSHFRKPQRLEYLHIVVDGYDYLKMGVEFGTDAGNPFLRDLDNQFAAIERDVSDVAGQPMRIVSRSSSAGLELLPDVPLTFQLEGDRIVRLRLEPQYQEAGLK